MGKLEACVYTAQVGKLFLAVEWLQQQRSCLRREHEIAPRVGRGYLVVLCVLG